MEVRFFVQASLSFQVFCVDLHYDAESQVDNYHDLRIAVYEYDCKR